MSLKPVPPAAPSFFPSIRIWLGRYALWCMPAADVCIAILAVLGLKWPAIIFFKMLVGISALGMLRKVLRRQPGCPYAIAAKKVACIQLGVMVTAEALTVAIAFLLPMDAWSNSRSVLLLGAFFVHVLVGIRGSHKLGAIAASY